jgi:hypothetical protein
MVRSVEKVLKRYGSQLTVQKDEGNLEFRGFLQHFRSKSKDYTQHTFSYLGQIPKGQYVLLAPVLPGLQVGDVLMQGQLQVEVRRLETVEYCGQPAYLWGLCVKKGGV